jgi:hypothetical protein
MNTELRSARYRKQAEYYRERMKEALSREVRELYAQLAEDYDALAAEAEPTETQRMPTIRSR